MISAQYWRLSVVNGTQCLIISIIDDTEEEETEYFQMIMSGYRHISGNYALRRFFNDTITVSIINDDGKHYSATLEISMD